MRTRVVMFSCQHKNEPNIDFKKRKCRKYGWQKYLNDKKIILKIKTLSIFLIEIQIIDFISYRAIYLRIFIAVFRSMST